MFIINNEMTLPVMVMNEEPKDAVDRLVTAYESMLERVHAAADTAEQKSVPWLREALANAREKAKAAGRDYAY